MIRCLLIVTIFFLFLLSPLSIAFSKVPVVLDPALKLLVRDYNDENYEEAIIGLEKFRAGDPSNALAAYYLGLSYKKSFDFKNAIKNLKDVLALDEFLTEALSELAEASFQVDKLDDTLKYIEQMGAHGVEPAIAAFLHGMVFLKLGKNTEAIEYFELAESLDEDLSQSVRYQIGVAHMREGDLENAARMLGEVVELGPETNLALNALEYLKKKREKRKKDSRLGIYASIGFELDDNVILKPMDESIALGISNKADRSFIANLYVDYTSYSRGKVTVKGRYGLSLNRYDKNKQYDYTNHQFAILSTFKIGNNFLNLPVTQNIAVLDGNNYLKSFTLTPTYFHKLPESYFAASFRYMSKDFLQMPPSADNDRDANFYALSLRWIKFILDNQAMVDVKYEISREEANGRNWSYNGHGIYASSTLPLSEKLKLYMAGKFLIQRFDNIDSVYLKKRKDNSYTLSMVVTRLLSDNVSLQIRLNYIRNESNIAVYDYERSKLATAMEYRY